MLDIEKFQNGHSYDCFNIKTDNGSFTISFENNLDLYWRYNYVGNILDLPEKQSFLITKENYVIYSLIDKLYKEIVTGKLSDGYNEIDLSSSWLLSPNNPHALVHNQTIFWRSDDYEFENSSALIIEPFGDEYVITFQKSKLPYDQGMLMSYSVRISNSGSRYNPFNIAFMKMYQDLKEYDPTYHQIHVEEVLCRSRNREK